MKLCIRRFIILQFRQLQFGKAFEACTGKEKKKVAPLPSWLSAQIRPSWASTILLQITNPRPVPLCPEFRPLETCRYFSNIWPISSLEIPIPVSLTHALTSAPLLRIAPTSISPPSSENFSALLRRLLSTWLKQRGSTQVVGSSLSI